MDTLIYQLRLGEISIVILLPLQMVADGWQALALQKGAGRTWHLDLRVYKECPKAQWCGRVVNNHIVTTDRSIDKIR